MGRQGTSFALGGKSYLGAEDGGLDQLERAAVDLDETLAGLGLGDSLHSIHRQQRQSLSVLVASAWVTKTATATVSCLLIGMRSEEGGWQVRLSRDQDEWESTDSRVTLLAEALNHLRGSHDFRRCLLGDGVE